MRSFILLLVVALLTSACTATVGSAPPRHDQPSKWEYTQDRVCIASHLPALQHDSRILSILEQRGREGWELVSVSPTSTESETCYLLIFKRETF